MNIFGGLSVLATPLLMPPIWDFLNMSRIEPRGACREKQARLQLSHPTFYISHSSLLTKITRPALQIPLFWSTLNIEPQSSHEVRAATN
jgi:hypothetical protein